MDSIAAKVADYIAAHKLIADNDTPVIVGLSGGADSVSLLLMLHDLGYPLIAAHCNYHLRGDESERDELAVRRLCEQLSIPLQVKQCTVHAGHSESVEMVCRRLRYDWFEQLRAAYPGSVVAVAHHKDDNAETLMLNLLRGTGIAGMRGMLPSNSQGIVRPLLCLTRKEIEEYLSAKGHTFVVDSTNLTNDYKRNCLRNDIFPTIAKHFPDYLDRITASITNLRSDWLLLRQLCSATIARCSDATGRIDLKALARATSYPQEVLYTELSADGFTRSQCADMIAAASRSGRIFHSPEAEVTVYIDRGILIRGDVNVPAIRTSIIEPSRATLLTSPSCAYFDADALGSDYTFRHWEAGDRMQPFGMKGRSKKVSDIFNDAKISVPFKAALKIMAQGQKVLWIPGVRRSVHYPVTPQTVRVLCVEQIF